jgi:hypothetical protein
MRRAGECDRSGKAIGFDNGFCWLSLGWRTWAGAYRLIILIAAADSASFQSGTPFRQRLIARMLAAKRRRAYRCAVTSRVVRA